MYSTYTEFQYFKTLNMRLSPRLKSFDEKMYKLIVLKRNIDYSVRTYTGKGKADNECKLENNLIRSKNTVLELALCNDWDWFVTLTLDKKKYNRHDLKKYIKDLSQFVRDYRKKFNTDIKYLFVPEQHLNSINPEDIGAWHIHGLIKGIPETDIRKFIISDNVPQKLVEGDYYNWLSYSKKFGWVSLGKVQDSIKVAFYIKKYITKSVAENNMELNVHNYYCSQKLKRAESYDLDLRSLQDDDVWRLGYQSDFVDTYNLERSEGEKLLLNYKMVMGDENIL